MKIHPAIHPAKTDLWVAMPLRMRQKKRIRHFREEQEEEAHLKWALRATKEGVEDQHQDFEEAAEEMHAMRRNPRRRRNRMRWAEVVAKADDAPKIPREDAKNMISLVSHKLQRSLKRCVLMERNVAMFSLPCTKEECFKLLSGHCEIKGCNDGCRASLTGDSASDTLKKLASMLGHPSPRKWMSRRHYGPHWEKRRDCSFAKFDMNNPRKRSITFECKVERSFQLDRDGVEHCTSMGKLLVKCPRAVSAVKPKKVHIMFIECVLNGCTTKTGQCSSEHRQEVTCHQDETFQAQQMPRSSARAAARGCDASICLPEGQQEA